MLYEVITNREEYDDFATLALDDEKLYRGRMDERCPDDPRGALPSGARWLAEPASDEIVLSYNFV